MCLWIYHLTLGILFLKVNYVKSYLKHNVSLDELNACRRYNIPSNRGYGYADFFHIPTIKNNKLADTELLHLKFYVKASADAHILLSTNDFPTLRDRVYEIVIGAGLNTYSAIRTAMGRRDVATNNEAEILSEHNPTPIEVIQTKNGKLLVYIPSYNEHPLMAFSDISPLNINYISFSTYEYTPARWFYNCQFDDFADELEADNRSLTSHQILVEYIEAKSESASIPPGIKGVNFSFNIAAIHYEHDHGFFKTRLTLKLIFNVIFPSGTH